MRLFIYARGPDGKCGYVLAPEAFAMAFSFARDGDEDFEQVEDPGTLAVAQRAWIVERDACDAHRDCLRNRMIDRVSALRRR